MRATYRVTFVDGVETEAVAGPPDIVQFERQYGVAWPECFADETKPAPMEWVYFLAWAPLHRTQHAKAAGKSFDEFVAILDDVVGVAEAPAAPFPLAPTGSDSAVSPTEPAPPSTA